MGWSTTKEPRVMGMKASLLRRGQKRIDRDTVSQNGDGYLVDGIKSFGDQQPSYRVRQGEDGSWLCSCFGNHYGDSRARRGCSHIAAVRLCIEQEESAPRAPAPSAPEPDDADGGAAQPSVGTAPSTSRSAPVRSGGGDAEEDYNDSDASWRQRDSSDALHPPSAIPERLDDPAWGTPPFPAWVTGWREGQREAVEEIVSLFTGGKRVVLLEMPTGGGKSLIAEATRRALQVSGVYTVQTKTLQAQIASEERGFGSFARIVMGRSNYPTQRRPDLFRAPWGRRVTCGECTGRSCRWCDGAEKCPYMLAKTAAMHSCLPVLNVAYFLGETNSPRSQFKGRGLVVFDEADELEAEVMRYVTIAISDRRAERLGIPKPRVTKDEEWWPWAEGVALPAVARGIEALRGSDEPGDVRERTSLERLRDNLYLLKPREDDEEGTVRWVYTGAGARDKTDARIEFKPVMVDTVARKVCFNGHGERYLLMSASFISSEIVAEGLGLDDEEVGVVRMPSTFPAERRPIFIDTVASVTRKTRDEAYPLLADKVREIMAKYPEDRGLVHTVSYDLANYLTGELEDTGRVSMYRSADEREDALRWMKETPGAVLFAPSFERGIDLPMDLCRFVIVSKVPYPYLGDPQVNARMRTTKNGNLWYAVQTIRRLVQQTGRGMRSEDDQCDSWILDREFVRLWARRRRIIPKWWRDAVVWTKRPGE